MNHIYRVIFNQETGTFQAVSEIVRTSRKSHSSKGGHLPKILLTPLSVAVTLLSSQAFASPTGGQVTAGVANIAQTGSITNINQSSQNAAINWQSFNVGKNETVNFNQPNAQSVTLNRVIGNERSVIDGAMNANGKVFISNANGMLIGKDAKINVGSLVATTANISDDDLMNGRYQFTGEGAGKIENLGHISVPKGGVVALVAPIVKNSGTITAHEGNVLLASAESFSITLPDNANFAYTLDKGTLQGLVDNGGAILADAGRVVLTAKGVDTVKKSLIKHSGNIEANTVQNKNGVIELLGDLDNSALNVSGSLKAEGKGDDKGGLIETSAADVKIQETAQISTKAENGKSGKWLLDPNDLIVGAGGTMTGGQVETALQNNGDFELKSTNGKADGKGDVIINDEISWNKGKLTLNAQNDIHINKTLNGTGTAKLALEHGQGTADGGQSDYYLDKNTPLKDRTVKVNLPEGKNFSTKKGSNGEVHEFDVIHEMPEILQSSNGNWYSKFTTNQIAFGADIDMTYTGDYKGFAGWELPNNAKIDGLGHSLNNLIINNSEKNKNIGLFQQNGINGYLKNFRLINTQVNSDGVKAIVGGLIGRGSNVSNSYVSGEVVAKQENAIVGGLVGSGINISNSHSSTNIFTTGENTLSGGLIGNGINISSSFATGNVTTQGNYSSAGGLAGSVFGIQNSYAIGEVLTTGNNSLAGGLAGKGEQVDKSYATGNVTTQGNSSSAGGLVGKGEQVDKSYATGNVLTTGTLAHAGGLVGDGEKIDKSYSIGSVVTKGNNAHAGGLVGIGSTINNSYATGNVLTTGTLAHAGGLAGNSGGKILHSYANNNQVSAIGEKSHQGGVVGFYYGAYGLNQSYFNIDNIPNLKSVGKMFDSDKSKVTNVEGKSNQELMQKETFMNWDFDNVWYINDGETPKLHAHKKGTVVITPTSKTDLGIQANKLNKVYDGKSVASESDLRAIAQENGYTDIVTISGLKNGDSVSKLGTLRYDGTGNTWQNAKNAGSYTIMPSGLTGGQDYEIKYGEGKLTIDKRPVEAILRGQKTYNTHNQAEIDGQTRFNQNGLIDDTVKFTGSVTLAGKDAGNHNIVDSSKVQITGDGAENYELKSVTGVWKINPQSVDATAIGSKVYDDSAVANIDDTTRVSFSRNAEGVYESDLDKVKLSGSVTLKGKDVGAHTIQDFNNATLTGEAAKNYTLKNLVGRWNITPAPVVITGKSLTLKGNREYDATNNAYAKDVDMQSLNEQLYDSDKGKIKIEGIGKLEDIHVGEQALKDKNTLALTGDAAKNYEIQVSGSKWEITPYTFSLRGNKTYDATTYADAKDVDQRYLDVFLFPNDKGKIQLKGTGSIVAANATSLDKPHKLADKGSLRLTSNTDPNLAKNYQINFDDSGWTVEKRKITATGEKVYNADNRIDAKDLKPSDVDMAPDDRNKGADALRIASGTALLNTKHVHQDGSRITETGTLKLSGSLADNYELTSGGYVKIQPAVLTVKAVSDTKTYDGTTASNKTPIVSGLQGADKLIEAKQEFLDKDVLGDGQSILKVGHFKVEDFNNGKNYKVVTESTKGTINPKVITTKFNKVYDGTELINHYHIDREAFHQQLINSDIESVQLVGSGELDNQNSGNRLLKQNRFTLFGKESNNYQLDMKNSQFRIDKRPISLVVRKYADNSTRFDWDPASLDNADNEVELLNVIKNQNNFDEINSFSIEGFSLETTSPKAGTYTGKDVTIKTPIKIKNDNYIFDLGNSSGILVQVAQDSNDFDFNTNEGQIVVREVEHEDDFFFGYTDKLGTLDLGWFGKHNIVNYRGFQISKPTEKTLLDGTTELTLPIFNTLDATLEIQVFDENGQIIDRQYADPHLLTTDVVDWFSESISDLNKEGLETSAVSTETEVKVKVPKGGKIKFTYNSPYAKRNNLAEPLYDLLTEALSSDDVSEPQEKELKRIIRDSLSDEVIQPLIDALGVGSLESLARVDLQKIDFAQTKKALENISDKIIEQLKETISVDTGLKIAVGVALENLNSVKIAKDFAEGTTKFLNLLSGTINYTRDLSKYDQEIKH